ncbi:hypothetical protein [Paramagnetospirillum caucaseum]|uniref:hypothetical protein n=1 Tax=Paramagnetospirillum caucaseum TaxID=1244869 RepID=UPI0012686697|nr:hypothetical protein [Paramagnetospirillum caucaseum]
MLDRIRERQLGAADFGRTIDTSRLAAPSNPDIHNQIHNHNQGYGEPVVPPKNEGTQGIQGLCPSHIQGYNLNSLNEERVCGMGGGHRQYRS